MMEVHPRLVKVFYSYSRRDKDLRDELSRHLGRAHISSFTDQEIPSGVNWRDRIDEELNKADILLLLVSADFLASEYCYNNEMRRALERHEAGNAHVIPIILRPVHWQDEPFSKLQVLPPGGKPVTSWSDRDDALYNVAQGIRKVISTFLKQQYIRDAETYLEQHQYENVLNTYERVISLMRGSSTLENDPALYKKQGDVLVELQRFEEALAAYDAAILLEPASFNLYLDKGKIFFRLNRLNEALRMYDEAIRAASPNAALHIGRGDVLTKQRHFDEALGAYDRAFQLDPHNSSILQRKGDVLLHLNRLTEASAAYDLAIRLDQRHVEFYVSKGDVLFLMRNYDEAIRVYEDALRLDTNNSQIWRNKGKAQNNLKKLEDALVSYEQAITLNNSNAFLYKEKGDILFSLARLEESLAAYEDAVNLKPDYGTAYLSIAKVCEELAKQAYRRLHERGEQAWKRAQELGAIK
jgi:tetratricopeptide (TPR) repeat protein